jgi:hypothetical protein
MRFRLIDVARHSLQPVPGVPEAKGFRRELWDQILVDGEAR